jgi:hypothetical protein
MAGRPKGSISKLNKSGLKEIKYDEKTVAKLREINASDEDIRRLESPFQCTCCGRRFKKQIGNFYHSESPLYNGNNHYISVCKNCIDNLLDQYTTMLNSQEEAIRRLCLHFDIYYSETICASAVKKEEDVSRMSNYISRLNLNQCAGKTYDTYLSEIGNNGIDSYDDLEHYNEGNKVTKGMFERWQGNTPEDIIFLEEHYKMLKRTNPNADNNQEIFIKQLCIIQMMQNKAQKKNDIAAFEKCIKMYRDTFKQAGLQTVQEEDISVQNPLGINAEIISQYTPEEFYKDKKLYEDFDNLGQYFAEHVERPLENLMFNSGKVCDVDTGDINET